jgi:hypothetical protein
LNALLAPGLRANPTNLDALYGRALARVLAHELFHVLAQTPHHAESGVAQSAVTGRSLLGFRFEFDSASRAALRIGRKAANGIAVSVTGF